MELQVVAFEIAGLFQRANIRFLREGDMDRGGLRVSTQGLQPTDQGGAGLVGARGVGDQQARAGGRGEGAATWSFG